jgi:ATP synthase protein I
MRLQSGPPRENIGMLNSYGRYASLGIQLAASMCVCGWIGYWLDGKLGTYPWLMILGLMSGAGAGFYALILAVNSAMESEAAEARAAKAENAKKDRERTE